MAWNIDGDIQVVAHLDEGYIEVNHDGDLIVDGYADETWTATECAEYVNELVAEANYARAQED
ncbi:hypothetical protein [Vibrio chagasii]|uniref:hypothetical protein n=1 Tax=Vibrio chagasii TaxID=170679 RepID=UPI003DA13B94